MAHLKNVPPAMLQRIANARQWVDEQKARHEANGLQYRDVRFFFGGESSIEVFEKLASHPEMERAWSALARVFDDSKRTPDTWQFANTCNAIIDSWATSPKRTEKEHKAHFIQIAEDLLDVVHRVIVEPEFGAMGRIAARVSPVDFISDDDIQGLIESLDASPEGGHVAAGDGVSYARFCLTDLVPTLYGYAEELAKRSREIAEQPSIGSRPHRDSAERTFFIRHISNWFEATFGERHHDVVASVASALFDCVVTSDHVRALVKGSPEVSPLYRARKLPSDQ